MELKEATEQFVDIVELGALALRRLTEAQLVEPFAKDFGDLLKEICDKSERLKTTLNARDGI